MRVALLVALLALPAAAQTIVAPDSALHDALPSIRVTGLTAGKEYDLAARAASRAGVVWRSTARFTADANGVIEPAADDASELFWSMDRTEEREMDASLLANDDQTVVRLALLDGEKEIATKRMVLRKRDVGVATVELREPLVGAFYYRYGAKKLPAVIVLGGSEGGVSRDTAALLASHGYAALAVAYFGVEGLPRELERIPVETVDRAVEWLIARSEVEATRGVAMVGKSKGAELGLLAASRNPRITSVVAIAPSAVVFQSITEARNATSSWSAGGKEVGFAPYVRGEKYAQSKQLVDLYLESLAVAPEASAIPVEKINGPILLIAGDADTLWPSAPMARRIEERLKSKDFKHAVEVVVLPDAGHHVSATPLGPTAGSVRLGGTPAGIAHAQFAAWKKTLEFLGRPLTRPSATLSPLRGARDHGARSVAIAFAPLAGRRCRGRMRGTRPPCQPNRRSLSLPRRARASDTRGGRAARGSAGRCRR